MKLAKLEQVKGRFIGKQFDIGQISDRKKPMQDQVFISIPRFTSAFEKKECFS